MPLFDQVSNLGPFCLSMQSPVLKRIVITQFSQNPHPPGLVIFKMFGFPIVQHPQVMSEPSGLPSASFFFLID